MTRQPRPTPHQLHLLSCDCAACNPPAPYAPRPRLRSSIASTSVLTLAGLAVGQGVTIVLDHVLGGPGPFVLFGL